RSASAVAPKTQSVAGAASSAESATSAKVAEEIAALRRIAAENPGAVVHARITERAARDQLRTLIGQDVELRWLSSVAGSTTRATGRLGEGLSDDLLEKLRLPTRSLKNNSDQGVDLLSYYDPVRKEYLIFEVKTSEVPQFSSLPGQTPRDILQRRASLAAEAQRQWAPQNAPTGTQQLGQEIVDNLNSGATVKGFKIEVQIPRSGQTERATAVITEWK
ncbi:MAG TPA: hypothetical protein VI837_04670, partial [Blastocatellia bacterium]|nr:hypothetical protein [Blastocatellia bacterium]